MKVRLKHERLAGRIAASGMTQNRWALRLGLSSGQLSELVNGKRPYPPARTRRRLLEGLGMEFGQLFEVEQEPSPPSAAVSKPLLRWEGAGYRLCVERASRTSQARPAWRTLMHQLLYDLRHSLRSLRRSPLFAVSTILTLALGISLNATVFAIVDSLLLKALPYPAPHDLAFLSIRVDGRDGAPLAVSDLEAFDETGVDDLLEIAFYLPDVATIQRNDKPLRVPIGRVSPNFFKTLGVTPWKGSDFDPSLQRGPEQGVLLDSGLWRRMGGDESQALPQSLIVDGRSLPVLGVLAPGFRFPGLPAAECWTTLDLSPTGARGPFMYRAVARRAAGISQEEIQRAFDLARENGDQRYPGNSFVWGYSLVDLQERFVGSQRATVVLLLGAVGAVLLIAVVNIANLSLARANSRGHEIAVRAVLGANRRRLLRYFLAEGVLLSAAAGLLGLLLASWLSRWLVAWYGDHFQLINPIRLDARVVLFALGVALACGVLVSLGPAWKASGSVLVVRLRCSGRGTPSAGESRSGRLLVTAEFALALTLLVGAGLLTKSLVRLTGQDPGFSPEGAVVTSLSLPAGRYSEASQRVAFLESFLDGIRSQPEVSAAGVTSGLPPDRFGMNTDLEIEGRIVPSNEIPPIEVALLVDNGYFEAVGVSFVRGGAFTPGRAGSLEAIVDESFAKKYFPSEDPIGKRLRLGSNSSIPGLRSSE